MTGPGPAPPLNTKPSPSMSTHHWSIHSGSTWCSPIACTAQHQARSGGVSAAWLLPPGPLAHAGGDLPEGICKVQLAQDTSLTSGIFHSHAGVCSCLHAWLMLGRGVHGQDWLSPSLPQWMARRSCQEQGHSEEGPGGWGAQGAAFIPPGPTPKLSRHSRWARSRESDVQSTRVCLLCDLGQVTQPL